ncbi:MAG: FtsX-like permease family protein [Lentisphaeraceae bacterium]|nr:FtsX-like permease family protein [Lentisphaeraceae bacterium]
MKSFFDIWCWKMAWRDSRSHRTRLFLFLSCISLGVAALVALRAFGDSVREGIEEQSRSMLGSDLVLKSRHKLPEKIIKGLQGIAAEDNREWRFASMAKFPSSDEVPRLVQVRGVEAGYPFYGEVETVPAGAASLLFDGQHHALIEESLQLQFGVEIGDKLRLGKQDFIIGGIIKSLPGESIMFAELSPRVLIPFSDIGNTGLIGFGSRVLYRHNFRYKKDTVEKDLLPELKEAEIEYSLTYETVQDRQERIDKTLANLFHFLNLVAFIALLLGGIGIGSAVRVHISSKLKNAAILRCLGASRQQSFAIYFIQSFMLGLCGGICGAVLGCLMQQAMPQVLNAFMPLDISSELSLSAIALGISAGVVITLLFSITPLIKLNRMTALDSLRSHLSMDHIKTHWVWLPRIGCVALIIGFSVLSAEKYTIGLAMGAGVCVALLMLVFSAWLLMLCIRKTLPQLLPFIWRQGLKNLYRPQNQTMTLITALGTGTFLIAVLYLTQANILNQVRQTDQGKNPNIVLFDIQIDQVAGVDELLKKNDLKSMETIPLVSMRLVTLNGDDVRDVASVNELRDKKDRIPRWTLQRTYRCTYRDHLIDGESTLEGEYIGTASLQDALDGKKRIPVSVEDGIMDMMKLKIGDHMDFDLGGLILPCEISSRRKVDWVQMRPNFFVIFPKGVLDAAPQMFISITRTSNTQTSVNLQKDISERFANVSVLDLTLVVKTLTNILDKASLAVKVMAGFSIVTGLIILISSLHLSQLQRLRENTLLKVLGASRRQVIRILFSEFCFLALLSANVGSALAYAAIWAMAEYMFDTHIAFDWGVLLWANVILLVLTLGIGFLISRKTYAQTSLETLRAEEG